MRFGADRVYKCDLRRGQTETCDSCASAHPAPLGAGCAVRVFGSSLLVIEDLKGNTCCKHGRVQGFGCFSV